MNKLEKEGRKHNCGFGSGRASRSGSTDEADGSTVGEAAGFSGTMGR